MSLTFTDLFCGAGGSSTGLVAAGMELSLAANHWARAIETHAANHPAADHVCADIDHYDMRRMPSTDMLWASPICTELSPAGGRRRKNAPGPGQLALQIEGPITSAGFERTRATFWDVLRAIEVHRYQAIVIENVAEAADWELFDIWLSGTRTLGYRHQFVSASSAHISGADNLPAPQWRDRIYVVLTREGVPLPDVEPRPRAWCKTCQRDVQAFQSWKQPGARRLGKYRQQYVYRCPNGPQCGHAVVEPYVRPAADIIDWSNLGVRIADRPQHKLPPLATNTLRRIRAGLDLLGEQRMVLTVNHGGHDGRPAPADGAPLASRTAKIGDAVVVPDGAFYVKNYGGNARPSDMVRSISEPFGTVTARDGHALALPPQAEDAFVVTLRRNARPAPVVAPVDTVTAGGRHHWLVIPYRNAATKTTKEPLHTLGTIDSAAVASPAPVLEECRYRMIQPREQLLAQRFPTDYLVHGNKGEQTMQAGNAVSCNVAQWLGDRIVAALSRTAAHAA